MEKEKRKIFMWNIEIIMIKNFNYFDICSGDINNFK